MIEFVVVVAIIAVLLFILVPVLSGSINLSKETACAANRRNAKTELTLNILTNDSESSKLNDVLSQYACPENGTLSYTVDEITKQIQVHCSVHDIGLSLGDIVYQEFEKKYEEYIEDGGKPWNAQGDIREDIYDSQGGWDEIRFANSDDIFYVKPKFHNNTRDYFVYANRESRNLTNGGWDANYIYNHEDKQWYCSPNARNAIFVTKSWDEVKQEMKDKGWIPVAVVEERPKK